MGNDARRWRRGAAQDDSLSTQVVTQLRETLLYCDIIFWRIFIYKRLFVDMNWRTAGKTAIQLVSLAAASPPHELTTLQRWYLISLQHLNTLLVDAHLQLIECV